MIFPKPDPTFYRPTISVTTVIDAGGGNEFVCEGAHIIVSCVQPHIDLRTGAPLAPAVLAAQCLGYFIPAPTPAEVERYLAAAQRMQPVIFLRKNLGLTHPDLPFHESGNTVFLDEERDVAQVLQIADQVPCGLSTHFLDFQTGMIPFTFPPPLDDWDCRIQQSMMELGAPFHDQAEATCYFCDKLEEASVDLAELTTNAVQEFDVEVEDDIIAHARRLARDALLCLQQHHVAVRWVSEILQQTVEQAAYQIRIKQEQEQISRRWDSVQSKNRFSAKRERQKCRQKTCEESKSQPEQETAVQRIRNILNDFSNKVFKYQHYRKAFHALQSTGLMDHFGSEMVRGSHHVLHGSSVNSVTVVVPHGASSEHSRHRFARSLMSIAGAPGMRP